MSVCVHNGRSNTSTAAANWQSSEKSHNFKENTIFNEHCVTALTLFLVARYLVTNSKRHVTDLNHISVFPDGRVNDGECSYVALDLLQLLLPPTRVLVELLPHGNVGKQVGGYHRCSGFTRLNSEQLRIMSI